MNYSDNQKTNQLVEPSSIGADYKRTASLRGKTKLFILGNGPSLKGFDFHRLDDVDTLGMNAAYRYWDQIDWYPTYYCCMDTTVLKSHAEAIYRLIQEREQNGIQYFLLRTDILDIYPELEHNPAVLLLEEFQKSEPIVSMRRITTGGQAALWGAFLGYSQLFLLGIDLSYTERIAGARHVGGIVLELEETPDSNPNYFFDGYQQVGDRFHIPNPDPDSPVHTHSWQEVENILHGTGISIFNCNPDSNLMLFPFMDVETARSIPGRERSADSYSSLNAALSQRLKNRQPQDPAGMPRLLLIDFTRIGSLSATGMLKRDLLANYPQSNIMQLYEDKGVVSIYRPDEGIDQKSSLTHILLEINAFNPDVIYYRPVDIKPHFHELALEIIQALGVPYVIHIMDDWPSRVRENNPQLYKKLDEDLRSLLASAHGRLSISQAMSEAYEDRYGYEFTPIANGIDQEVWADLVRTQNSGDTFIIRHTGSLAEDMRLKSVLDIAQAVSSLHAELPVELEIYVPPLWEEKAARKVQNLPGVSLFPPVASGRPYHQLLKDADCLLVAYNFDEDSVHYTRYSKANKLPEYLATGNPVLAYGPREVATISYIEENGIGEVVTDLRQIKPAIRRLIEDADYRKGLGERGQDFAFRNMAIEDVQTRFYEVLIKAAQAHGWRPGVHPFSVSKSGLVDRYPREQKASINEIGFIKDYYNSPNETPVMLDVGAHQGSSSIPFAKKGWRIVAFEPDKDNLAVLQNRTEKYASVTVDKRALSDQSQSNVAFYTSDESTGASSLLAFTQRHEQTELVDTVTLTQVCQEYDIQHIDLLKIDVEGFELPVLKGIDWKNIPSPEVIIAEFEDNKTRQLGYTAHDLAQYLQGHGYHVYISEWHPVLRYGIKHDWHRIIPYPVHFVPGSWGNLIAFRQKPDLPRLKLALLKHIKTASPLSKASTDQITAALRGKGRFMPLQLKSMIRRLLNMIRGWASKIRSRLYYLVRYFAGGPGILAGLAIAFLAASFFDFPYAWAFSLLAFGVLLILVGNSVMRLHIKVAQANNEKISRAQFRQLQAKVSDIEKSVSHENELNELRAQVDQLSKLRTEVEGLRELRAQVDQLNKLRIRMELMADIAEQVKQINAVVDQLGGGSYNPFSRVLHPEAIDQFQKVWSKRLGLPDLKQNELHYYSHRIRMIENVSIGRLATSTEAALLRSLIALSIKTQPVRLLEIGTLFGIGASTIYEICRTNNIDLELHLIDPLQGYYGERVKDTVLNIEVSYDTLLSNLSRADIPLDHVNIYQGLSTDKKIIKRVNKYQFDAVLIDGDHSRFGVKADFQNYLPAVKEGGYILFDDYDNPAWPDVKDFVEEEVRPRDDMVFVGADWHTAVFRKLTKPAE